MRTYLDDTELPGFNQRMEVVGRLEREDLSGDTSGTAASYKGWKPWAFSFQCQIRYRDADQLIKYRELFQARDDVGANEQPKPHLYRIVCLTTAAMGVNKVRFTDDFTAKEDDRQQVWNVSFRLIEERSIPERTDERGPQAPEALPAPGPGPGLTYFDKILAVLEQLASKFTPKEGP